jgi:acetolactate synthase-1/2/3 large subunit
MLPSKVLIHIDADPLRIGRTWPTTVPVVSNAKVALERLMRMPDTRMSRLHSGRFVRRQFLQNIRKKYSRVYCNKNQRSAAVPMHPARVVSELRAAFPDDGVLCVDSGAHRAWFAEYWTVKQPNTHFSLTNLGPMGGAIPLGIGVKLAVSEQQPVMVATSDGCTLMHGMELHTAVRENVALIIALMNNRSYGNIWYRAHKMGKKPEALTDILGIDWVKYAESMGAIGETIKRPDEIASAVKRALRSNRAYVLDLQIDKTYATPISPWKKRQKEWEDND